VEFKWPSAKVVFSGVSFSTPVLPAEDPGVVEEPPEFELQLTKSDSDSVSMTIAKIEMIFFIAGIFFIIAIPFIIGIPFITGIPFSLTILPPLWAAGVCHQVFCLEHEDALRDIKKEASIK
jgi:hypothetical protein